MAFGLLPTLNIAKKYILILTDIKVL